MMNELQEAELQEAVKRVKEARKTANEEESKFLLMRGWEDQGTFHGVTWWYHKGSTIGGSQPQNTAMVYALQDLASAGYVFL